MDNLPEIHSTEQILEAVNGLNFSQSLEVFESLGIVSMNILQNKT